MAKQAELADQYLSNPNTLLSRLACTLLVLAIWLWMRDRPNDIGLEPCRSSSANRLTPGRATYARGEIRPMSFSAISEVVKTSTFWILAGCMSLIAACLALTIHRHNVGAYLGDIVV